LAIDLDDTLLTDDLTIPPSALSAIAAARKKGVRVVVATGRMFQSALPHARAANVDGPLITYNGALVRTLDGRTLSHQPIAIAEALELADLAVEHGLCLNFYIDDELYVSCMDERTDYYLRISDVSAHVEPDLSRILTTGPTKALIVDDPQYVQEWRTRLTARFGERLSITISKPRFLEIMSPGVSKGVALSKLAKSLGIEAAHVMVIGDSFNDLPMFAFAGISVAVGNADPAVQAQADYVVASSLEGGVAEAISRFILTPTR
jgi:Cof subfamily protein (haloacid dehalogenase superfamily)